MRSLEVVVMTVAYMLGDLILRIWGAYVGPERRIGREQLREPVDSFTWSSSEVRQWSIPLVVIERDRMMMNVATYDCGYSVRSLPVIEGTENGEPDLDGLPVMQQVKAYLESKGL